MSCNIAIFGESPVEVSSYEFLNYWIPITIISLSVYFGLKRRTKLLKLTYNAYSFYQFSMIAVIAVPLLISQYYLEKGTFDLIQINSIYEVDDFPKEKYFSFAEFKISKDKCTSNITSETLGKSNDRLIFKYYSACLFEESKSIWCGINFRESLSNRMSKRDKNLLYNDFIRESNAKLNRYDFQEATYFEKLVHSNERIEYFSAIEKSNTFNYPTVLVLKKDIFEERLGNTVKWFFGSFVLGTSLILGMILFAEIDQEKLTAFKADL